MNLLVIVPVLNEEASIKPYLDRFANVTQSIGNDINLKAYSFHKNFIKLFHHY